jgi:phosphotriesterase-related protein
VVLPFLVQAREAGVVAIAEATPSFLAKDADLLVRLSRASGVHLLTNVGWYKPPYTPARAGEMTAEEIATEWIREAEQGLGSGRVKPGFIKIAANEGEHLDPLQKRIVQAAALTSAHLGLAVMSHTTQGHIALEQLDEIEAAGIAADRFIVAHADADPRPRFRVELARRGAWVELDSVCRRPVEQHVEMLTELAGHDCLDRVLISQDAGWYTVGEDGGGEFMGYTGLVHELLPALRESGFGDPEIRRLTCTNPVAALALR